MDSGLLEVMIATIIALVFIWLLVRFCFRVLKILVSKGPDFIKYLVIIIGITSIIWMYYNPLGARALYERAKYLLFGTPSVSLETGGKSEATILLGNNPKSHYKLIQSI